MQLKKKQCFSKQAKITSWRKNGLEQAVLAKLDFHMQRTEIRPLAYIAYKNQLTIDQGSKSKT